MSEGGGEAVEEGGVARGLLGAVRVGLGLGFGLEERASGDDARGEDEGSHA